MGKVSTKPQVDQEGQQTGNLLVEIAYGGLESPFGGIDSSAPPAYIDGRCFAAADGFIVVDNKLVVTSLAPIITPTLWNGVSGVNLLKFGTFYNSLTGQLNYVLGYTATAFAGPPSGVNYVFYITAWNPANSAVNWTDVLPITLFDAVSQLQQASLTLDCIATSTAAPSTGSGATGTISSIGADGQITGITVTGGSNYGVGDIVQIVQGSSIGGYVKVLTLSGSAIATVSIFNPWIGYLTGAVTTGAVEAASAANLVVVGPSGIQTFTIPAYASGYTRTQLVAAMVTEYAGLGTDVSLSASADGFSLVITANVPGTGGNAITVQDTSTSEVAGNPPPLYFSARVPRNLEGGAVTESALAPRSFNPPASTAEVGGTLYIANIGPMILKYSGPGLFTTSTMYNGVGVLRKFAGSLIGLRLINQLGVFTQNQDMILAFSATEDLDEWAPVNTLGNVTGAGFLELADIGDYLVGLIVSNNTAFIIRSQGISYATSLGSATDPYQIAHIGLGDEGEGGQIQSLVAQYDQTGAFIGNSDVYQVSSNISSIGTKIKTALFQVLLANPLLATYFDSLACAIFSGGDVFPIVIFSVGQPATPGNSLVLFIYNAANSTWASVSFQLYESSELAPGGLSTALLGVFNTLNLFSSDQQYNQVQAVLAIQNIIRTSLEPPNFYYLADNIGNEYFISNNAYVTFPQEELLFGRDVTIDAIYIALWGILFTPTTPSITLKFLFNGVLFATLMIQNSQLTGLSGAPLEFKVFPAFSGAGTGVFTAHSPQLTVQVPSFVDSTLGSLHISKIQLFGTFDPNQRPV